MIINKRDLLCKHVQNLHLSRLIRDPVLTDDPLIARIRVHPFNPFNPCDHLKTGV
jgi:hypothetical protein